MARWRSRSVGPRWLVVAAVASILLITAVVPTGDAVARSGPLGIPADLWLHAIGYAVLEVTVITAIASDPDPPLPVGATPVAVVGYGVFLEGVQSGITYRSASGLDVLADAVGAVVALGLWGLVTRLR